MNIYIKTMTINISDIRYFLKNCKYQNKLTTKEFELVEEYSKSDLKETFEEFLTNNNYTESSILIFLIKESIEGYKKAIAEMQKPKSRSSWGY